LNYRPIVKCACADFRPCCMKPSLAFLLQSRLSIALALAAMAIARSEASPPRSALSLCLTAAASTIDGAEAEARLRSDEVDIRALVAGVGGEGVEAGFAASFPYVRLGATRPAGLAAFVYGPASAAFQLLGRSGSPLALDGPGDAAYLGASLGEDFGIFAATPLSGDGTLGEPREAFGAWLSPRGGRVSALAMACGEPGRAGGPSWYDAPEPPSRRAFAAVSAQTASVPAAGSVWAIAAAAVGSAGFPGPDAAAGRLEARASSGRFRLEAIGSVASGSWTDPDGAAAPRIRLDSDVRYSSRGFASTLGYRYTVAESALSRYAVSAEMVNRLGFSRVGASMTPATDADAAVVELDTRLRPAMARWLTLSSSWRAVGGEATRLDALASIRLGDAIRAALDCGGRLSPDGSFAKGSVSVSRVGPRGSLCCSVRSVGWIASGDFSDESVEYAVRATAMLK